MCLSAQVSFAASVFLVGGGAAISIVAFQRLCCTNPVRDSSHESSVVAGMHEQTYTRNLQDQELASIQ